MSLCINRKIFPQENEQVPDIIPPDFLSYCPTLQSIIIPEGVAVIGDRSFIRCENLSSVTLPNSLISIGDQAFYNCEKLKNIRIPENLEVIGREAFMWTGINRVDLGVDTIYSPDSFGDATVNGGTEIYSMDIDNSSSFEELEQEYFQEEIIEELVEEDMDIYIDEDSNLILPHPIVNTDTLQKAQNLRVKYINMSELPANCNDVIMFSEENIGKYLEEDNNNIVFFKKTSSGYVAECFGRDSLKTILNDDKGNYLFYECKNKDNLSNVEQKQLYIRLPVFGSTFMPYEYVLNLLDESNIHPLFLIKYINKIVNYSVNYGVYHHVLDFISAWHCNPGSNFKVNIPIPIDAV